MSLHIPNSVACVALLSLTLGACGDHPGPSADRPEPSAIIGARCTLDSQCASKCEDGGKFPGGFCTSQCFAQTDCPDGTVCIDERSGVCVYPCSTNLDCNIAGSQYICKKKNDFFHDSYHVCLGD